MNLYLFLIFNYPLKEEVTINNQKYRKTKKFRYQLYLMCISITVLPLVVVFIVDKTALGFNNYGYNFLLWLATVAIALLTIYLIRDKNLLTNEKRLIKI